MDVWGNIYVGKRWTEDDGAQRCEIRIGKEWQVTTTYKLPAVDTVNPEFTKAFATMAAEVMRQVTAQLKQIQLEMLYLARYGAKEAKDAKKQNTETDKRE